MPTVSQLPYAVTIGPTDRMLLDQNGLSVSATAAILLAGTQPALSIAQGTLLGRVSSAPGGPEAIGLGSGLVLAQGTLAADAAVMAPLNSPALTGMPTAPTQPAGTASTTLATTAFVASSQPALVFTGDVVGSGSSPVNLVLPPITTPGVFPKVTVNSKGQVTAGSALAATDITLGLGYIPYNATNPSGFVTASQIGSMARQSAGTVAITGGTIAAADISAAVMQVSGGIARNVAARAADRLNVLDFGADPTGAADSAPAFNAVMGRVVSGTRARLFVPRGTYFLSSIVYQLSGSAVTVEFDEGAAISGPGFLAVDRVDSHQGVYRFSQAGSAFQGAPAGIGAPGNPPLDYQIVLNTPDNSASARVAWARTYTNTNRYSKYSGGIDFAQQNVFEWPWLLDNSSGCGHWEVVGGPLYDENTAARAQLSSGIEHSEFDVVNNGPDYGWSFQSGISTAVQGMSMDPWGQNGLYGGHILYAYGSVGAFDGVSGGINQRWVSYPAVYSAGNPGSVPQGGTIVVTMDVTAKATAYLSTGGAVVSVTATAAGGAYTSAPSVVFNGGGGSGATATATMLAGAVIGIALTAGGAGYISPPTVTFVGGGAPGVGTTTVLLNSDGAHGDLVSVAAAIRAANIPLVSASAANWGGAVHSLVVFGTAAQDLGTLTLGGSALPALGINPQPYVTLRADTAVAFGSATGVAAGDRFTINGQAVTVGGAGTVGDVVLAINNLGLVGVRADVTATGRLSLSAWLPQQAAGLVLGQPAGFTTLQKLALTAGIILPPTPPKAFATAQSEVGGPACLPTDALSITATDLSGNIYGPLTVMLNGGGGSGSIPDVAASIRAAIGAAGWLSQSFAFLTAAPAIVACFVHNGGATAGLVLRNTAGGTLTLANAAGAPLDTLGLVAGTFQPGGYSAASQSVFMAAPNSIAPQGRGVFVGGSTAPDITVWPNVGLELRNNFGHGLRTDHASFADGRAVLLGAGQAIGWGIGGATLSANAGLLTSSVPARLPGLVLTGLPSSTAGLPSGSVWNNGGILSIV